MDLEPFLLDRWLAKYQFASPPIRYDLAASTGPKWTVGEVLALGGETARAELERLRISYAPPNGGLDLRTAIASAHGIDPDLVVVTTGASEAMSAVFCLLAEPGGNAVLPSPVFPAIPVIAEMWAHRLRRYELSRDAGFAHRAEQILGAVDDDTQLVLVNSPHNPTGAVMRPRELEALAESLAKRGVPLVVDEVYHPLYFETPAKTAAHLPNTIVIGDLSKAYSLSGLRIGWVIDANADRRERLIDARGYLTISNSVVTELLASGALSHREQLLQRLERVARTNLAALDEFMRANDDVLGWVRPAGGTTAFPWLKSGGDSRPLCESLAARGVLTVPGDCFAAPNHLRIGYGAQAEGFRDALAIVGDVLRGSADAT